MGPVASSFFQFSIWCITGSSWIQHQLWECLRPNVLIRTLCLTFLTLCFYLIFCVSCLVCCVCLYLFYLWVYNIIFVTNFKFNQFFAYQTFLFNLHLKMQILLKYIYLNGKEKKWYCEFHHIAIVIEPVLLQSSFRAFFAVKIGIPNSGIPGCYFFTKSYEKILSYLLYIQYENVTW